MKEIRIHKGKHLSDLDLSISYEKSVHDMVMFLTKGRRGGFRFRKEFNVIFNANYTNCSGGYMGRIPVPRLTITSDILNSFQPRIYKELISINKNKKLGQFYGEHQYITSATIAHLIAHIVIDTPYLHINGRSDKEKYDVHGSQWRTIYMALREKFVNPYVEPINYNWKADLIKRKKVVPKATYSNKIMVCRDCGEHYKESRCRYDDCAGGDNRCMGCHVEMNHGLIPDPEVNQNQCGNAVGYPIDDIEYFPRICDRFYYGV